MNKFTKDPDWKVYFNSGFWKHRGKDHAGTEIPLASQFAWYDALWHVPAVYVCSAGLVIDLCIQVAPEKIKDFFDKWSWAVEDERCLTAEQIEQIEAENPLIKKFSAEIQVNGKTLRQKHGCSLNWIPEDCGPEGIRSRNAEELSRILAHYQLDPAMGWVIYRSSFAWDYRRKPVVESLGMNLSQQLMPVVGKTFRTAAAIPGDGPGISEVHLPDNPEHPMCHLPLDLEQNMREQPLDLEQEHTVTHPLTGREHTITIKNIEKQELDVSFKQHADYDFPRHFCRMDYTLEPELSDSEFYIGDCLQNDSPKRKNPEVSGSASAIGVIMIGRADVPTAIFVSGINKGSQMHAACSALHFEPADHVEWKMVFQVKRIEDIAVELIGQPASSMEKTTARCLPLEKPNGTMEILRKSQKKVK